MSDPIEAAVRTLRGQPPPGGFASADAVRRRGTRRTHRQVATAAVAVLAVAGGVVTWAGTGIGQQVPRVTTASSPSPSGKAAVRPPVLLTPAMFLTAADLGAGDWVIGQSADVGRNYWYWQGTCQPYRRADYPSLGRRAQMDWRDFSRPDGTGAGFQMIERYQPGVGPGNLTDVRARLRDCAGLQSPAPAAGGFPLRWTPVADGFAGDDAVLAKHEVFPEGGPVQVSFTVAVRVGDLVSTIMLDDGTSEAAAREIAAKAADRLR
jgi:hypothetical protein